MLRPRKMIEQEKALNDKIWELRIKYNDFDDFTDNINDFLAEHSIEEFKEVTTQFRSPADYLKAVATMSKYISEAQEVPPELYEKIKRTREDFKRYFEQNN